LESSGRGGGQDQGEGYQGSINKSGRHFQQQKNKLKEKKTKKNRH